MRLCVSVSALLTLYALLILVQLDLLPCEMSSVGREDEEESLVSVLMDTVAVQRIPVLSQPLPDHPALHRGGETEIMADL